MKGASSGYKVGVFVVNGKVYTGDVYGNNNEILKTAVTSSTGSDGSKTYTYTSYWGAEVVDPNATLATMRVSTLNSMFEVVAADIDNLNKASVKTLNMEKAADGSGQIYLETVDGTRLANTIKVSSENGQLKFSQAGADGTASEIFATDLGTVVTANPTEGTEGAGTLETVKIGDTTYKLGGGDKVEAADDTVSVDTTTEAGVAKIKVNADGQVASGNTGIVTGGTVAAETRVAAKADGSSYNVIDSSKSAAENLAALDAAAGNAVQYNDTKTEVNLAANSGAGTKITNVARGELSASSQDAVNGAQLYEVSQAANKHTQVKSTDGSVTVTADADTTNGTVYDLSVNANGTVSAASTAAVSGQTVAAETRVAAKAAGDAPYNVISADNSAAANLAALDAAAGKAVQYNDGKTEVSLAANDGTGTKITNVANGTVSAESQDAVNGSQLYSETHVADKTEGSYSAISSANTVAQNLQALDQKVGEGVTYDAESGKLHDGKTGEDVSKLTVGKTSISSEGKISGVAAGELSASSTDAVNGSQVWNETRVAAKADGSKYNVIDASKSAAQNLAALDAAAGNAVQYSEDKTEIALAGEGGTKITNLKADEIKAGGTSAVTTGQLYAETHVSAPAEGTTYNAISADKSLAENLKALDAEAGKHTTVTSGNETHLTVEQTKNADGSANYKLTVNAAGIVADGNADIVSGGTVYSETRVGEPAAGTQYSAISAKNTAAQNLKALDQAVGNSVQYDEGKGSVTLESNGGKGTQIGNVAKGTVAEGSLTAVNGDDLYQVQQTLAGKVTDLANTSMGFAADSGNASAKLGGSVSIKGADSNIQTSASGSDIQVKLADDIKVSTVTAGANADTGAAGVVLGSDGVAYNGKTYISTDGLNANGQKVTGVKDAEAATDAVNKRQLDAVAATAGSAVTYDAATGKLLDGKNQNAAIEKLAVGSATVTSEGIDNGGKKVTNLAEGAVSEKSSDAVTGAQLYRATKNAVAGITGDEGYITATATETENGKQYTLAFSDDAKTAITNANTYLSENGITANGKTITDVADGALAKDSKDAVNGGQLFAVQQSLDTLAGKKITFKGDEGSETTAMGDTFTIAGDKNITTQVTEDQVQVKLSDELEIAKSVTVAGANGAVLSADGIFFGGANGASMTASGIGFAGQTYISADGLNANGKQVQGVADGKATTDAVNKGQLDAVEAKVDGLSASKIEFKDSEGNSVKAGLGEAVTIEGADANITTAAADGKLQVKLSDNLDIAESVKVGGDNGVLLNKDGVSYDGKNYIGKDGLNANGQKVSNVGAGDISSADSTDAVNGGQLYQTNQKLAEVEETAGNAVTWDKETGQFTDGKTSSVIDKVKVANTVISADGIDVNGKVTNVADGKVESGSKDAVNGGQLYDATRNAVSGIEGDGKYIETSFTQSDAGKSYKVSFTESSQKAIDNANTYLTADGITAGGKKITNVAAGDITSADSTDAVNGGQLFATNQQVDANAGQIKSLWKKSGELNKKINRTGANAAALAALHPLDYDEDHKVSASVGIGQYHGNGALAVGVFIRPTENLMLNLGGSFASEDKMFNAGLSYRFGDDGSAKYISKADMVTKVNTLSAENQDLAAKLTASDTKLESATAKLSTATAKIDQVTAENQALRSEIEKIKAQMAQVLSKLAK